MKSLIDDGVIADKLNVLHYRFDLCSFNTKTGITEKTFPNIHIHNYITYIIKMPQHRLRLCLCNKEAEENVRPTGYRKRRKFQRTSIQFQH